MEWSKVKRREPERVKDNPGILGLPGSAAATVWGGTVFLTERARMGLKSGLLRPFSPFRPGFVNQFR
jgi:hypothetical protein